MAGTRSALPSKRKPDSMLARWFTRIVSDDSAVSAVEYALLIALIVMFCITVISALGDATRAPMQIIADLLVSGFLM
jgi:Flp pilus assembly pilin Flp